MEKRYLVIPVSLISQINFNEVGEDSEETLYISLDGQKTFVKYNVEIIDGIVTGRPSVYSNELVELTTEGIKALIQDEFNSKEI
jgi:hypothetical protein